MTREEKELKFLIEELKNYNPISDEYKKVLDRIDVLKKNIQEDGRQKLEKLKLEQQAESEVIKANSAKELEEIKIEATAKIEESRAETESIKIASAEEIAKKDRRSRFWSTLIPALIGALTSVGGILAFVFTGLYSQKCDNEGQMMNKVAQRMFDATKPKK